MKPISYRLFFTMFFTILLLSVDYAILKSLRHTLAVLDGGSGAKAIPLFELVGVLPASALMTWGLGKLMKRGALLRPFVVAMGILLTFFIGFSEWLYPLLKEEGADFLQGGNLLFFTLGELWKPCLMMILFFGLLNRSLSAEEAKRVYPPLLLASSLGSLGAGPLISLLTSEFLWKLIPIAADPWIHSIRWMVGTVVFLGLIATLLFSLLSRTLSQGEGEAAVQGYPLLSCLYASLRDRRLTILGWIVIADYIAYSLGEVLFLDVLRQKFPNPKEYCSYLGVLGAWMGGITSLSALFVAPKILGRFSWQVGALITPICLLATEGAFFVFLRGRGIVGTYFQWTDLQWVNLVVALGSIQYCLCRAAKYSLFDPSKEIAFISLPGDLQMKGKLVIDGICARLGRGGSSALSLLFSTLAGGVIASSLPVGIVALSLGVSWTLATIRVAPLLHKKA